MLEERNALHSLAIVEDDSTVGPAIVVGLAEVGEDSHTNSLQSSLVTEGKGIAVDLVPKTHAGRSTKGEKVEFSYIQDFSAASDCLGEAHLSIPPPNFKEKGEVPTGLL